MNQSKHLLLLLASVVVAAVYSRGYKEVVPNAAHGLPRLNQELRVANDPNQDIRTNVLLNLEGF
jgi:hypothetical protein